MIKLQTYTTKELCLALNIKETTFKSHKENYLDGYKYEEVKIGRSKCYKIIDYKEKAKSEFISLCEKISNSDVSFPNEKNAEKILKVLLEEDCTILDYEELGYEVNLERHTVGAYIKLFRIYKILPLELQKVPRKTINIETGEILSKMIDPNKYIYYVVSRNEGFREELTQSEYYDINKFIKEKINEYLDDFLTVLDSDKYSSSQREEIVKEYLSTATRYAYSDCINEHGGIPKKTLSKIPTKKAYDVFSEYFNLCSKKVI